MFYGVDYGSTSQMTATVTAGASGVATGTSPLFMTYNLGTTTTLASLATSKTSVAAGGTFVLTATLGTPYQANVPVWFFNATDYSTLTATATKAVSSYSSTSGTAIATWTVTAPSTAGTTAPSATSFTATQVLFSTTYPYTGQVSGLSNSTATAATANIVTVAGALAKLVVNGYLTNPGGVATFPVSKATYGLSTNIVPKGTLYLDVVASDANGNPVTVTGTTQVTLTTSAGSLSVLSALVIPNAGTDTASTNLGSSSTVALTPPTTVGSVTTVTASVSGATGSNAFTTVAATPTLTVTTVPTTITAGVPVTFSGTVNATKGIQGDTITQIQYTVNWKAGATPTSVGIGSANAAWSFSVLLSATGSSAVNITAVDSQGTPNVFTVVFQVPPIPAALTFTNSTNLKQVSFTGGPAAVNATFTNNAASSLTVIIVANVISGGAVILESTATVTAAAGATVSGYPVIQGIAHGTYTVQVTVYSTSYVTLSPTKSLTVTV